MPSGANSRGDSRSHAGSGSNTSALTMLALLLLAVLPYLNTLGNGLVYDDLLQINGNPYVHSFRYLRRIFGSTVWTFQGAQGISNYYRPLMTLAYLLCYKLYGTIPFGYHLVNLTFEAAVVLLLFAVTERLFQDRWLAFVAAALFALHPMHTESVAWVASLPDLELTVFFLLTLLFYLHLAPASQSAEPESSRGWPWKFQVPMMATCILAFLSKEQALMLPVVATIYEHFYRPDRGATSLGRRIARYAPLWVVAFAYFCFRKLVLGGFAPAVSRPTLTWAGVLLNAVALTGTYLGKLIWPVHFSVFYVFHEVTRVSDPRFLASFAALLLCLILFIWLWRRDHLISFAFLFMGVMLGPVLNARWMPAGVFAERYLYIPSIGFCWLLAWAAGKVWRSTSAGAASAAWKPLLHAAVPVALAILAVFYASVTVRRNRVWRGEDTLYAQTLAVQPDAQLIRTNVGVLDWARGDSDGAEREWTQAAAGPHAAYAPTLNNLGMLRAKQQRYDEAIDYFQRALVLIPDFVDPHVNLGKIYADMGRPEEAERQFRAAVTADPMSSNARNTYGHFLFDRGRMDEAKEQFARSAEADDNSEAEQNLGDIYLTENDTVRARQAYRAALEIEPFDTKSHFGLGAVNERDGRVADAMREYHAGLDTDPLDADALRAIRRLTAQLELTKASAK